MVNKTAYIASGWFNEKQANDLANIKHILKELDVVFFSPKDECLVSSMNSEEDKTKTFNQNVNEIKKADFIIANTRDKDMGTIFECGVAFSNNKPIIYYCDGLKGGFNLMLSKSGIGVATSLTVLKLIVYNYLQDENYTLDYVGEIE